MSTPVLHTPICDLLGIRYPILMAGMGTLRGRVTPPRLVAAVSNAGGLGVMGASSLAPEEIRQRIRQVRALTDKPFGVDLLLPVSLAETGPTRLTTRRQALAWIEREYPRHYAFVQSLWQEFNLPPLEHREEEPLRVERVRQQVQVVLEEKVPVFAAGLGDPAWVVPLAREAGIKVIGLAGSVRNALRQVKAGVDIIVAQGYEAGGHTGRIATFPLVPQVVDAVAPTPVLAAGGIADGRGVAAALALGAQGVWVGTAFLVALESDLYPPMQDAILQSSSEDFIISRAYSGKTARLLKNPLTEAWERSGLEPLPMPLQGLLMADLLEAAERAGRYDLLFNAAGQIGGMLKERKPAAQIVEDMVRGAVEVLETFPRRITYRNA
ncbi:MAG: nitronate monooxygenase [Dehalococcoidia bacterium]|nr:nitronate monooxygenase [Dehalococcoidia bacterium]MDW8119748.1 nitronate monooxygenase [Chloroflexota bacterium]